MRGQGGRTPPPFDFAQGRLRGRDHILGAVILFEMQGSRD